MNKNSKDPRSFENVASEFVRQSPETDERTRPDISQRPGQDPAADRGSPTWDKFAAGVRDGLGDFVSRLHGERGAQERTETPEDKNRGFDR